MGGGGGGGGWGGTVNGISIQCIWTVNAQLALIYTHLNNMLSIAQIWSLRGQGSRMVLASAGSPIRLKPKDTSMVQIHVMPKFVCFLNLLLFMIFIYFKLRYYVHVVLQYFGNKYATSSHVWSNWLCIFTMSHHCCGISRTGYSFGTRMCYLVPTVTTLVTPGRDSSASLRLIYPWLHCRSLFLHRVVSSHSTIPTPFTCIPREHWSL